MDTSLFCCVGMLAGGAIVPIAGSIVPLVVRSRRQKLLTQAALEELQALANGLEMERTDDVATGEYRGYRIELLATKNRRYEHRKFTLTPAIYYTHTLRAWFPGPLGMDLEIRDGEAKPLDAALGIRAEMTTGDAAFDSAFCLAGDSDPTEVARALNAEVRRAMLECRAAIGPFSVYDEGLEFSAPGLLPMIQLADVRDRLTALAKLITTAANAEVQ